MTQGMEDSHGRSGNVRTGNDPAEIKQSILDNLYFSQARIPQTATLNDWYMALAYTVRDRMLDNWLRSNIHRGRKDLKIVSYLSAEYLMGPHLGNNLINLGIREQAQQAVSELGLDMEALLRQEAEPGLGNGGLGRLAACYMDSLATLQIPAIGYGIRYEFGIFDQEIVTAGRWKKQTSGCAGQPLGDLPPRDRLCCEVRRPHRALSGRSGAVQGALGPEPGVKGVAYDTPIAGYHAGMTNCSVSGSPRLLSPSIFRHSTWATTTAPSTRRSFPRPSPRSSTRMTSLPSASASALHSNTSSSPAHSGT